jgi:hypothetical protein
MFSGEELHSICVCEETESGLAAGQDQQALAGSIRLRRIPLRKAENVPLPAQYDRFKEFQLAEPNRED